MEIRRRRMLKASLATVGGMAGLYGSPADAQADGAGIGTPTASNAPPLRPGGRLPADQIERIMQTRGKWAGDVFVISLERKDLKVRGPHGHPFHPSFALEHAFYFQSLENGEVFMNAEFTFLAEELQKTMSALLASPLEIMAQHQHYIGESPQTFHYHFRGRGSASGIAHAAMSVVKATSTPLPQAPPHNPKTSLPVAELEKILGSKASVDADGIVLFMIERPETFVEDGVVLKPHMNVLHKIAFEPLDASGSRALCGADYALRPMEIRPALKRSHQEGFEIHCLYNQQTAISPSLFFSHNLKAGDPVQLAESARKVLDTISDARPDRGEGRPARG